MIYLKGLIHAVMCFLVITLLALQSSEKNTSHLQWLGSLPEHPTIFCGHRLVEWTTGWIKAEDWHKIAAHHRHGPVWHNLTEQSTDCQQVHIYIFTPYNPGVFVGFFIQSAHLNWQKKIVNTQHLKTERKKKKQQLDQQLHLGIIILSMAQMIWSQFLQNIASSVTAKKVQMIWKRLFIIGAMNFAIVETHTKMTVMKAKITFMHFPRSTLALTVSVCCACCSCWWSSSFETRVWHVSKAS